MNILKYALACFISLSAMPSHDQENESRFQFEMIDDVWIANRDITRSTYVFNDNFIATAMSNLERAHTQLPSKYDNALQEFDLLLSEKHQGDTRQFTSQDEKLFNELTHFLSEKLELKLAKVARKMNCLQNLKEDSHLHPDNLYHILSYYQDYTAENQYKTGNIIIKILFHHTLPSFIIGVQIDLEEYFIAGSFIGNSLHEFDKNSLLSILHPLFDIEYIEYRCNKYPAIKMQSKNSEFEMFIFYHKNQLNFRKRVPAFKATLTNESSTMFFTSEDTEKMMNLIKKGLQVRVDSLFS